jgi:hypothetical protein
MKNSIILILLCYINIINSHPLCSDGLNAQNNTGISYCTMYSENSCCNQQEDLSIENEVQGFNVNPICEEYMKQMLCTECDPWAAHLRCQSIQKIF